MIWCVEDDSNIREMEIYTLKQMGFEARGFENGEDFFYSLESETPELILLDIMLPEIDGIEILKRMRSKTSTNKIPVIMVTAKGQEYDKVNALDIGADDYLVKPFGMMEMISRIKAILRRVNPTEKQNILKSGVIELNLNEHTAYVGGEKVSLTYKEFEILKLFLLNPKIAFTRDQLFTSIWGEDYQGESRTIDVHIQTLRSKLGECGNMIETVRNIGYRFEENL